MRLLLNRVLLLSNSRTISMKKNMNFSYKIVYIHIIKDTILNPDVTQPNKSYKINMKMKSFRFVFNIFILLQKYSTI